MSADFSMLLKKMVFSCPLVSVMTRLHLKPLVLAGPMHWKTMYGCTKLRRSGCLGSVAADVTVTYKPRMPGSYLRVTPCFLSTDAPSSNFSKSCSLSDCVCVCACVRKFVFMSAASSRGKHRRKKLSFSLSLSLSLALHTCARNSHQDVGSLPCALKTSCKVLVVAFEKTVLTSGASCPCALPPEPRDEFVCPVPPSDPVPPNGAIARLN